MAPPPSLSTTAIASAMLEASLDAIVAIDQDNVVVEWNPAAEQMFGYSRPEALGQSLSLLIVPPEYQEAHERGMKRFVATWVPHLVNHRVQLEARRRAPESRACRRWCTRPRQKFSERLGAAWVSLIGVARGVQERPGR